MSGTFLLGDVPNLGVEIDVRLRCDKGGVWKHGICWSAFDRVIPLLSRVWPGATEFFKVLSSKFAEKEGRSILAEHEALSRTGLNLRLVRLIKGLHVIERLNAYTAIYHSDWEKSRSKGGWGNTLYQFLILLVAKPVWKFILKRIDC